jgi:hypothetical protein
VNFPRQSTRIVSPEVEWNIKSSRNGKKIAQVRFIQFFPLSLCLFFYRHQLASCFTGAGLL